MIAALSYMTLGFFLGMRHAADADHVAAVGTFVTRHRTVGGGIVVGAVWGLGHTLTILVVGGAIIVFRVGIPPVLGLTLEMMVAVMLLALGTWSLRPARPSAPSTGRRAGDDAPPGAPTTHGVLRPLVVGLVHGLAGSAGVAFLVLGTIDDARWAIAYLALFGIGTMVGMMLITAGIAVPFAYASSRSTCLHHHLRTAAGLLSVAVGLGLVYQVGFVDGLFTARAVWPPR